MQPLRRYPLPTSLLFWRLMLGVIAPKATCTLPVLEGNRSRFRPAPAEVKKYHQHHRLDRRRRYPYPRHQTCCYSSQSPSSLSCSAAPPSLMASEPRAPQAELDEHYGSRYEYVPFGDSCSIRILTLEPGVGDEPLVGSLEFESLDARPDFEAISYVWGAGTRSAEMRCDGRPLSMTRSIHDALRCMRHPARPRRLWADQVCINQDDLAERSQQVNLMNQIFKGARHILVWLGPDRDGFARAAVAMVHHLHGVFTDEEKHREFQRAHSEGLQQQDGDAWVPLSKLTKLPWFGRIWIVQEIGTATPATLHWGDEELDWEVLSSVVDVLNLKYHHLRSRFHVLTPSIRYLYRRFVQRIDDDGTSPGYCSVTGSRASFVYQLQRARHLQAGDPRDQVYAFLGHFSKYTGSPALAEIKADYSRPVKDIFYDLAIRELEGTDSLLLLSACYQVPALPRRIRETDLGLPSWVPDWRRPALHMLSSPVEWAAGDSLPRLRVDAARGRLYIRGLRVDSLDFTSWTFQGNAFGIHRAHLSRPPLEILWRDACGHGDAQFSLERRCSATNGDAAFLALTQTLSNAGGGFVVPADKCLADGAAYLVRTLGPRAAELVTPELQQIAARGDAFQWCHKATLVTRNRRFAITVSEGRYVIGPGEMMPGDVVVVLYGGATPFVLRRVGRETETGEEKEEDATWKLIGECYVHGIMDGEVLVRKGAEEEEFVIV
ncbi:hypothetical protein RB595_004224 [Gaeumannomyces hyphopodioides]